MATREAILGTTKVNLSTTRRNCTTSSTPHLNPLPLRGEGGVRSDATSGGFMAQCTKSFDAYKKVLGMR
jgi:hypothetical protein